MDAADGRNTRTAPSGESDTMSRLDAIHLLLACLQREEPEEREALTAALLAALGYEGVADAFDTAREAAAPAHPPQRLHLETLLYH